MRAIILGAGKPGFCDVPISNLEIQRERLLDIQISCLRGAGASDIYLATGYRHDEIRRADIASRHNTAWASSGSLSSLALFGDLFDGEDDVLLLYGDTLMEPAVIQALSRSSEGIAAACFLDRSNSDIGRFREYARIESGAFMGVSQDATDTGIRTVFTGLVLIRRQRSKTVHAYIGQVNDGSKQHVGHLLDLMSRHGVNIAPVIIEHGWVELSSEVFYQNALSSGVFLERVIQLHTDWTARAKKYDKLQWVNNDRLLAAMISVARAANPRRVIDVGTGSGKVLLGLRETLIDGEFWGIDTSQAMLDNISDRHNLTLRLCDVEKLEGIPDRYFDLVTARMVFHHVSDIPGAMRNISRILRPGGMLVVCEGVPPSSRSIEWYTEMFRFKEDRHTLTEGDIINMYVKGGFAEISTNTVTMKKASLNNWLDNSGIPQRNIDTIKELHYNAPTEVAEDYDMEYVNGDCLMSWRFAIVSGRYAG